MLRKLAFASAALAVTLSASMPFAAENNYVPTRTILQQTDVPGSNYTVVMAVTDIHSNMTAARHTHPGPAISYMLAGEAEVTIEGRGIMRVKAGESFRLESGVKHSVKVGPVATKILAIYTIPKGAALSTPAPE
jgi:quercetin dioxygenase-like cupin family protein